MMPTFEEIAIAEGWQRITHYFRQPRRFIYWRPETMTQDIIKELESALEDVQPGSKSYSSILEAKQEIINQRTMLTKVWLLIGEFLINYHAADSEKLFRAVDALSNYYNQDQGIPKEKQDASPITEEE